jgi:putative aldouronate transport system permease protein
MRTFYKTQIPDSLIESARMDGATEWLTWFRIVLPLSTPGLATIALFSTIGIWNNFFLCLILTDPDTYNNLQYTIYTLLNNIQFLRQMIHIAGSAADLQAEIANMPNQTFRMAMVIVTIGPIVLAYPFFQKYFVRGLTIGALKG